MALAINNNLMANNVTRNLQGHYSKLGDSTQRLSSGLRVNSAADDAAGLAIRELMRADVAALNQGVRNANDGISLIQTADGALGVIDSKLIRMKELAEQAATDTYTDAQRSIINEEYQAMADEITRIAEDADFNGRKLLNGAEGGATTTGLQGTTDLTANADGSYTLTAAAATLSNTYDTDSDSTADIVFATTATITDAGNYTVDSIKEVSGAAEVGTIGNVEKIELKQADGSWEEVAAGTHKGELRVTTSEGNIITMDAEQTVITATGTANEYTFAAQDAGGTATTFSDVNVGEKFSIHFGSSSADTDSYNINLAQATAKALGIGADAGDDVSTTAKAKAALDNIQKAIETKDNIRATLGATQNRLEATIENVSIQKENLQAAESRISDVDVATEMTEFSKQQILSNAAVSMLSQANNLPQMAQKLIG